MPKRVLFLAYRFPPNGAVASYRAARITKTLCDAGWEVDVATVSPDGSRFSHHDESTMRMVPDAANVFRLEDKDLYDKVISPHSKTGKLRVSRGVHRVWNRARRLLTTGPVKSYVHQVTLSSRTHGVPSTLTGVYWGSEVAKAVMAQHSHHPYDLVVATTPPRHVAAVGYLISRMWEIPFVVDYRDLWLGNPLSDPSLQIQSFEDEMLSRAAGIIAVTRGFAHELSKRTATPVTTIYNGFDPALFPAASPQPGALRLVHAGTLYEGSSLAPLVEAIGRCVPGSVSLDLYGRIDDETAQALKAKPDGASITFHGFVDANHMHQIIAECDGSIVVGIPGDPHTIRAKTFECLAMKRYGFYVGPQTDEAATVLESCGLLAGADRDVDALYNEIQRLISEKGSGVLAPEGNDEAIASYTQDAQAPQFIAAFESAINAFAKRKTSFEPQRPVITAVMEATTDETAVRASIDALRANSCGKWELLLIADKANESWDVAQRVATQYDDARIRLTHEVLSPFEEYSLETIFSARADYFIRLAPGYALRSNFVKRVADKVASIRHRSTYIWQGSYIDESGASCTVDSQTDPKNLALSTIVKGWLDIEGEYALSLRPFRLIGGFSPTHTEGSRELRQMVLLERAVMKRVLFDADVARAYARMKAIGKQVSATVTDASAWRENTVTAQSPAIEPISQEFSSKTVLFLRQTLTPYDARLMKEASALKARGAQIAVVGSCATVPSSLVEAGFDVRPIKRFSDTDAVVALIRDVKPDVIHAHDIYTYSVLKTFLGDASVKIVYECRDLVSAPGYRTREKSVLLQMQERKILNAADGVIAVSQPAAQWMTKHYGRKDIAVILHGATTAVDEPTPVGEPVRLLFQGALHQNRGLFTLVQAMSELRGSATLAFQGFGEITPALRQYVSELGLDDIISFVKPCHPFEVVESAARYDVGVICYAGTTENLRRTSPNKLLDYMAAGLALAVTDLPGLRSVATDEHGVFLEVGSAHKLAQSLAQFVNDSERIAQCKQASLAAGTRLAWSNEQEHLVTLYRKILRLS